MVGWCEQRRKTTAVWAGFCTLLTVYYSSLVFGLGTAGKYFLTPNLILWQACREGVMAVLRRPEANHPSVFLVF